MKKVKAEKLKTETLKPTGNPDEFKLIARTALHPDPDQPRKTFTEASLKELADSIAQQGIVQPLIVRLVKAQFKIQEPDLHRDCYLLLKATPGGEIPWTEQDNCDEKNITSLRDNWAGNFGGLGTPADYQDRYVIVAGERRWRAAEIAGLTELPCIVRDLDAHRVFAQQFIENEQRENITAIEEADALTKQLQVRKLQVASFSVEDLAAELGMSRAGLYQRLALTRLHPPVREALLAGKISTSVASVVAIIPLPNQQEKLLKKITNEDDYKFPFSVRDVQAIVDEEYCKQLSQAPFDTDKLPDFYQWNEADGMEPKACKDCPHRSGNMVDQFPELAKRPHVCTKTDCFAQKCKAHWVAKSQDLAQKGKTVLVPKEFNKLKGEYVRADKATPSSYGLFSEHWGEAPVEVLGKHAPEPVYVATTDGLEEYFKKTDLPDAAKKAKVKMAARNSSSAETPEQKTAREAKEKAQGELRERRQAYVTAQIPELLKALAKLKAADAWALGVELVKSHDGYCDDELEAAAAKAKDDQTRVLGFLFADNDNSPLSYGGGWDEHGVKLWKRAGIDLVKGFEASEAAAQKTITLPKAAPKQEKLLDVKPNKKKGKKK